MEHFPLESEARVSDVHVLVGNMEADNAASHAPDELDVGWSEI
jgi:hypothetical protein